MNLLYKNKAELEIFACGETHTVCSNEVAAEKIMVRVIKTEDKQCVFSGDHLKYTVKICNDSNVDLCNAIFYDDIPEGLCYTPNSFKVNGHHKTPQMSYGNRISYCLDKICAKSEVTIVFDTIVS